MAKDPRNTQGRTYKVPENIIRAGRPVNDVHTDSPESLDEALSQGDDRDQIDSAGSSDPTGLL